MFLLGRRKFIIALSSLLFLSVPFFKAEGFGDFSWHGFLETDYGYKLISGSTPVQRTKHETYNMFEQRLQLKTHYYPEWFLADWNPEFLFRGDFVVDDYFNGKTDFQLREFYTQISPASFMDVKIGRQVFTWGTGTFLFINDVFPKDYVSFLIGRNDEYLKAPSDGMRISLYDDKLANLDIVVIPVFKANVIPNGDRLSFFDPFQGGIAGRASERRLIEPPNQPSNTEYAARLYRTFGSLETALYFYHGFYEMPRGYKNQMRRELFYPKLNVYGASLRGPFLRGIGNIEAGFYQSLEDKKGTDRLIENSSFKIMAGFERDFKNDWTIGLQYMYERMFDYGSYLHALMSGDYFWDKSRQTGTLSITKLFLRQTLHLSLFTFFSPTEHDIYIRPVIGYDVNDNMTATLGANLFWGDQVITQWGGFDKDSNVYFRLRQSF